MEIVLHNTLGAARETLTAADGETLRMYCCGPTVYGPAHIGNFRTFILQDILRRVLELNGQRVRHVRNITDVDDKTIRQSSEEGVPLADFTARWRKKFEVDCRALGLLDPHVAPSAVEHIPQQITLIERLVTKGLAYLAEDGSVYFRIAAFPDYGRLSGLDRRELKTGAAGNQSDEYDKESVADFVLWKAWRESDGPVGWDSPWGRGRPGWHIECSAMAMHYLGESFDLHSGGVDLCFPHHENEIAQSEGATGQKFVRHWFHVEHLMVDGAKMSKSLGNLYTLEQLSAMGFSPATLRYVLASGHYRRQLNFTLDSLRAAVPALRRLAAFRDRLQTLRGEPLPDYERLTEMKSEVVDGSVTGATASAFAAAWAALAHDLNTPEALGHLFTGLKAFEDEAAADPAYLAVTAHGFARVIHALGLSLPDLQEDSVLEIPSEVRALAEERWAARSAKDWARSDVLRDELLAKGWRVKDAKDSYALEPAT